MLQQSSQLALVDWSGSMFSWCAYAYTAMVAAEDRYKMVALFVTPWTVGFIMNVAKLHMSLQLLLHLAKQV